jgi:hypothetical protein
MVKMLIPLSIILFLGCTGFVYEKKIYKDYYLIGIDTKTNLSISLKLKSGDYIGRIERVKQYAIIDDSLIFAKSIDTANKSVYYVLNMKKDFDVAKTEDIIIGPLDSETFIDSWAKKYKINFVSVSGISN